MRIFPAKVRHAAPLALASLLALLAGCDDDGPLGSGNNRFGAEADFSFDVALENRTEFDLAGINGNVTISGSSTANSFSITGTRRVESDSQADADAHLDDLQVEVESNAIEVSVRTDQPQNTGGRNYVITYEVTVPAGVEVAVVNVNGNIDVRSIANAVSVDNTNGNVTLDEIVGDTRVGNVNGNLVASVTIGSGGTIDLGTVNGNVSLAVPASTSAELEIQLANGTISTSGLTISNEVRTQTSLTGVLGGGDGTISLGTVNGNVSLTGS